jgi:sigma-B regulation protein RsbU (phosphoserine phosphatase)
MTIDTSTHALRLTTLAGPAMFPITLQPHTRTLLGRATECDVSLPDNAVSRRHAVIFDQATGWMIEDAGSRHGTFVNGSQLAAHAPTPLRHGDLLRLGPFTFRVDIQGEATRARVSADTDTLTGTVVEQVSKRELDSLAHQRLDLMIEGSAAIFQAQTETELAESVIRLLIDGTGFPRAALLRWYGTIEETEVVAYHDQARTTADDFTFSRSLLQTASTGTMARLTSRVEVDYGQSIQGLGIAEALCAPLSIDSVVVGCLYLDVRQGESRPHPNIASFCHAVSQVASLALASLKHAELARRQEALEADLRIAQEAQSFLLPPATGSVGRIRYASRTCAGSTVGGDLFDIFAIDEHRTGICFGDITGHGIGAAILMTAALSYLRATLNDHGDPARAVSDVNGYIFEHSSMRMFATLWVGVYDANAQTLLYVDAGHGHWLTRRRDGAIVKPGEPGGMVAGIQPDFEYVCARLELEPGDRMVLYSDGVIEQPNDAEERFGTQRLHEVIARATSIDDDVAAALKAVEQFVGNDRFDDDTTIASIEVGADAGSP